MKKLSKMLLSKSQDAFLLSLEVYNKPTIKYRIESFCFFFTNAWELLIKAKIIETEKSQKAIFYKKTRNGERRSLSLKDCLNKIFPKIEDPVRNNIENIEELRNSATHLIIDELDVIYTSLFQAGVLNYVNFLKEWFEIDIIKKTSPAMLSLILDLTGADYKLLKKKYNKEIVEFFSEKQKKINETTERLKDKKYNISIEYKIALVKNPKEADIVLSSGKEGVAKGILIEVPKDPSKTHPLRTIDCIEEIKKKIGKFNQYDFQSILFKESIRGNPKYHYCFQTTGTNTYSKELLEFILKKVNSDRDYLKKARESFRIEYQKKRREKNNAKSSN